MKIKCDACGYEFEGEGSGRCPRCGKTNTGVKGCENCKGCSLFRSCATKDNNG